VVIALPGLDRSRDTEVPSGNTIKPMEPNTGMREFRETAAQSTATAPRLPASRKIRPGL
jgi:hypothetical protein